MVQERVIAGSLTIVKVPRDLNASDLFTHNWTVANSRTHFTRLGFCSAVLIWLWVVCLLATCVSDSCAVRRKRRYKSCMPCWSKTFNAVQSCRFEIDTVMTCVSRGEPLNWYVSAECCRFALNWGSWGLPAYCHLMLCVWLVVDIYMLVVDVLCAVEYICVCYAFG